MATDVGTLQGKLELDMTGFNNAMNQATNLVRQFGQQLQGALGSTATQGFSATNQAVQSLAAEMQSLTSNAQNLISVLGQLNSQMQGFLTTMQTSSSLGANMNAAATGAQNTANATGQTANNTQSAAQGAQQLNSNLSGASRNASKTSSNTQGAATGANKAANNAKKLSNNLSTASTWAANVKRILEGIVISQTFYKLLSIMQDLVSNANEFMMYMEQSSVAFKYLLGSSDDASGMLEALQDFAISSPLDMQGATSAARMLMTMGFEAENTVGVLRTLTDAATVAGGDMEDTVNRLSLALGQMLQSGTVKAQEVRQLVNANIPIYEILQEELGLTSKQVANIGQESINSATAVNAILRGLQKRFKGASEEMQQTLTGALSASKDAFYVLYSVMMQGPYDAIREKVVSLSNALTTLAKIARTYGVGGVLNAIVPEWLQPYIRNLIGAFMQLGYALKYAALCAKDIFGASLTELIYIFNLILPPITIFLNALLQLCHYLLQTYPILRYVIAAFMTFSILTKLGAIVAWFWKVLGLGKICLTIASYVKYLMKALAMLAAVMVAHPAVLIFTAIAIAALVATGAIQKVINKLKELFALLGAKWANMNKTLNSGLNIGYDPSKIAQPTSKANQDAAEKYNNELQDIVDSMNDVGDAADDTSKKIKQNFNQSFDEVFTIDPTTTTASDLGLDGLTGLDLSDTIGQLDDLDDALGDISGFDLSGWDEDFMSQWDEMWNKIKQYLKSFGLGALLAGLLTTLLTGNPWLGLAAALAALFWPAIAEKLGLTKDQGQTILGAALGALLGGVIAKICKVGLLKGAVWSGIGALIFAGLWPAIQEYMDSGDWKAAVKALNFTFFLSGIGALIGNIIGGPLGAIIGGVIGAAIGNGIEGGIDALVDGEGWKGFVENCNWSSLAMGLGGLVGTVIGGIVGGPAGAAIGAAIGSLVGWVGGTLFEKLQEKFGVTYWQGFADILGSGFTGIFTGLGAAFWRTIITPIGTAIESELGTTLVGSLKNGLKGGILGAISGLAGGLLTNALTGWIAKELDMSESDLNNSAVGQSVGGLIGSIVGLIVTGGNPIGSAIGGVIGQVAGGIVGLFANDIAGALSNAWTAITNWCAQAGPAIASWASSAWSAIQTGVSNLMYNIGYALGYAAGEVAKFVLNAGQAIKNFFTVTIPNAWASFKQGWTNFWTVTFPSVLSNIGAFFQNLGPMFVNFFTVTLPNAWNNFKQAWYTFWTVTFPNVLSNIGTFFVNAGQAFVTFFTTTLPNAWNSFTTAWTNFWTVTFPSVLSNIGTFFSNLWSSFLTWGANIVQGFWQGIQNAWNAFLESIHSLIDGFVQGFKDALGIHSPSTVFMEIGGYVVQGLLQGIQTAWTSLTELVGGLVTSLVTAVSTGFTNLYTTVSTAFTNIATDISTWATDTFTTVSTWVVDTATSIGSWVTEVGTNIATWASEAKQNISNWATSAIGNVRNFMTQSVNNIGTFVSNAASKISSFVSTSISQFSSWSSNLISKVSSWASSTLSKVSSWVSSVVSKITSWSSQTLSITSSWASNFASRVATGCSNAMSKIASFISDATSRLSSWASSMASTISGVLSRAASAASSALSSAGSRVSSFLSGHAEGGIFNREHLALLNEGNKAEAVIPLENASAMQPFVDAVSNGLTASLAPILANMGSSNSNSDSLQPLYVGTLIADDKGLKELERRMKIIRVSEDRRS